MNSFLKSAIFSSVFLASAYTTVFAADKVTTVPCPFAKVSDVIVTPTADMPCEAGSALGFGFGAFGAVENSDSLGGITATVMLPLSDSFSMQVDGMVGLDENSVGFGQLVSHSLYHVDNASFGTYSSYSVYDSDPAVSRLGGEFSFDTNGFTLAAIGGWQNRGKNNLFVDTKIGLQLGDSAEVYGGYAFDDISMGKIGFEVGLFNNASLTGEARIGEDDYKSVSLGLQFDFGGQSCKNPSAPQKSSAYSKFSNQYLLPRKARKVEAASNCTAQQIADCPTTICSTLDPVSCVCVGLCNG